MLVHYLIEGVVKVEEMCLPANATAPNGSMVLLDCLWFVDYVIKTEDPADASWEGCGTPL